MICLKKNRCKFTIQFNPSLPSHREAIEKLNHLGHGKANYIASLISADLNDSMAEIEEKVDDTLLNSMLDVEAKKVLSGLEMFELS